MTALDWRKNRFGAPRPCRLCGLAAMCRDDDGEPCHKVCAEAEADVVMVQTTREQELGDE